MGTITPTPTDSKGIILQKGDSVSIPLPLDGIKQALPVVVDKTNPDGTTDTRLVGGCVQTMKDGTKIVTDVICSEVNPSILTKA